MHNTASTSSLLACMQHIFAHAANMLPIVTTATRKRPLWFNEYHTCGSQARCAGNHTNSRTASFHLFSSFDLLLTRHPFSSPFELDIQVTSFGNNKDINSRGALPHNMKAAGLSAKNGGRQPAGTSWSTSSTRGFDSVGAAPRPHTTTPSSRTRRRTACVLSSDRLRRW